MSDVDSSLFSDYRDFISNYLENNSLSLYDTVVDELNDLFYEEYSASFIDSNDVGNFFSSLMDDSDLLNDYDRNAGDYILQYYGHLFVDLDDIFDRFFHKSPTVQKIEKIINSFLSSSDSSKEMKEDLEYSFSQFKEKVYDSISRFSGKLFLSYENLHEIEGDIQDSVNYRNKEEEGMFDLIEKIANHIKDYFEKKYNEEDIFVKYSQSTESCYVDFLNQNFIVRISNHPPKSYLGDEYYFIYVLKDGASELTKKKNRNNYVGGYLSYYFSNSDAIFIYPSLKPNKKLFKQLIEFVEDIYLEHI
ncbi:MAG: hypothetical protein ABIK31_01730 [candidate division WOR-3 bacterium]